MLKLFRQFSTTKCINSTSISTLSNGIRVVSTEGSIDHFVSVGVLFDAGTKYENKHSLGLTHILDRMAFKACKDYSTDEVLTKIETLGGNIMAQSSRESFIYQSSVFRHDLDPVLSFFSSIIKSPLVLQQEVDKVCESVQFELDDIQHQPDKLLPELLHSTAFRDINGKPTSYGIPTLCEKAKLKTITSEMLKDYRDMWFTPNRMVIAGVGMDHKVLLEMAKKYFGDIEETSPELVRSQLQMTSKVSYTGGVKLIDANLLPPSPNPDDIPFTNVHIAFESFSMHDPDMYALAVLASMMGGGGSFSAGGPGKGMYTRLYTDVLNRYHWIESCHMINHSYADTGLFGISAAVPPIIEAHEAIIPILCDQMFLTTQHIKKSELQRAKNQLKSQLLMGLESKIFNIEDMGRQVLATGKRIDVGVFCERIDSIGVEDLKRAARRVFLAEDCESPLDFGEGSFSKKKWVRTGNGEPTVVVKGNLFNKDPLYNVERVLSDWKIGRPIGKNRFWPF